MAHNRKEIDVDGRLIEVETLNARDKDIVVVGRFMKIAKIEGDGYEDVEDLDSLVDDIRTAKLRADAFTFLDISPETQPRDSYLTEWESVAALPIKGFDHWWNKQIPQETRTGVRKAEKNGIVVKVVPFTDELVQGIKNIYDESPMRQGKPFVHYGKDFALLKKIHGTFLGVSDFLGAYYRDELIGFMKLVYSKNSAGTMNIISKIAHRDKRVTNALIAKAVETCATKGIPYLTYCAWSTGGIGEFKRRNGFEKMDLPRYYIPLTAKGDILLKLKFHRRVRRMLPEELKDRLVRVRARWYSSRCCQAVWSGERLLRGKSV
jgi:hypothetical protein